MKFAIKIYKNKSVAKRASTHKKRRFMKILRSIKWQDSMIEADVKVTYGRFPDHQGRLVNFYNDGSYDNKNEFWLAVDAFMEG